MGSIYIYIYIYLYISIICIVVIQLRVIFLYQNLLVLCFPSLSHLDANVTHKPRTTNRQRLTFEDALDQLTHLSGLIMRPVSLAYYQPLGGYMWVSEKISVGDMCWGLLIPIVSLW